MVDISELAHITSIGLWLIYHDISILIWFINQVITEGAPPCRNHDGTMDSNGLQDGIEYLDY